MVTETSSVGIKNPDSVSDKTSSETYPSDVADRVFGCRTSKGYGPGVLDFFGVKTPANGDARKISGHSSNSLNRDFQRSAVITYPWARRLEDYLNNLDSMIKGYFPQGTRKALVRRSDFLDLGRRINALLEKSEIDPSLNRHYQERYNQLVAAAHQKCQEFAKVSQTEGNQVDGNSESVILPVSLIQQPKKRGRPPKNRDITLGQYQEAILTQENVTN
jgi:hypothetical protein